VHHIDVHVTSIDTARKLLDELMPAVGYEFRAEADGYVSYWKDRRRPSIGFIEEAPVGSGAMRLAFGVATREAVDGAAEIARANGARDITGPMIHAEYGDDYYAVFFEDADGNKYEVVQHS
jgi:hypothetical protein